MTVWDWADRNLAVAVLLFGIAAFSFVVGLYGLGILIGAALKSRTLRIEVETDGDDSESTPHGDLPS